jgi:hypothetical protein
MKEELDTHAHKHISYIFHKNKSPIFTYTRTQWRGWRLVCEREQWPPSVFQPNEAGKGKAKERENVERLLSIIIKIYTPSLHYLCFFLTYPA